MTVGDMLLIAGAFCGFFLAGFFTGVWLNRGVWRDVLAAAFDARKTGGTNGG